jgi:tRNA(fMet)-specific endonuclease VapC
MTAYMLDTNICSFLIRGRAATAEKQLMQLGPRHDINISAVSLFELRKGALARQARKRLNDDITAFLTRLTSILPFDQEAADEAARIHASLSASGQVIGVNDAMIAGHAIATGCVMVTNNVREFERVQALTVEDWAD